MPEIIVRAATEADLAPLTELDVTYTGGERFLALERAGMPPELTFSLRWRDGTPREVAYDELTVDGLRGALEKNTDAFLVAEVSGELAGYLMLVKPRWTDAAEITDLAVHRPARRHGVGRALVMAASDWARERSLRGLWAEPPGDDSDSIDFYLRFGFRISGFNDRWSSEDRDDRPTVYMYLELLP